MNGFQTIVNTAKHPQTLGALSQRPWRIMKKFENHDSYLKCPSLAQTFVSRTEDDKYNGFERRLKRLRN